MLCDHLSVINVHLSQQTNEEKTTFSFSQKKKDSSSCSTLNVDNVHPGARWFYL